MILPHAQIRSILRQEKTEHRIPAAGHPRCPLRVGESVVVRPHGEPALARVLVTSAHIERVSGVDSKAARREGFGGRDPVLAWAKAWLARHDRGYPLHAANDEDVMDRIRSHHVHRDVWVVGFRLDPSAPPRLLHRQSERGYTTTPREAVPDEPEAVDAFTQARITRAANERQDAARATLRRNARAALEQDLRELSPRLEAVERRARALGGDAAERVRLARANLRRAERDLQAAAAAGSGEDEREAS